MTSSYQARKKDISNLKDKVEEEKIVKYGVMSVAGRLNYEKKIATNKMQGLFNIITKYGNEEALREAYKLINQQVLVNYKAIEGTRIRKNGEEHKCWSSVWGKFAGCINKPAPILNGYIVYEKDEDFDYCKELNVFIYRYDKVVLNNIEVEVVK